MTNEQAIILGITQGLTEYLPVSSSAHLVLLPHFLDWSISEQEAFAFDVLVQLGTLFGVMIYFLPVLKKLFLAFLSSLGTRNMFLGKETRVLWMVFWATLPAAILGLLFKNTISQTFSSPRVAGYFLLITALLLWVAEKTFKKNQRNEVKIKSAFLIGLFQSLALFPGVSRSGATISAGVMCGLTRVKAAEFSFLMSIPVMVGASLVAFWDLFQNQELLMALKEPLLFGFFSAAISGYLVIGWFMRFISHRPLYYFSVYCMVLGLLSLWSLS